LPGRLGCAAKILIGIPVSDPSSQITILAQRRYVLAAIADDGSAAQIDARLTQTQLVHMDSQKVCGASQSGRFPGDQREYDNERIGRVLVDVQGTAGGPLSRIHFEETSGLTRGGFLELVDPSLGARSELRFTGTVQNYRTTITPRQPEIPTILQP
jgi:hypothetical protein